MSKKISTTIYITPEQQSLLKDLNRRSKVPIAEFIREGIDLVIQKNQHILPGQLELKNLPSGKSPEKVSEKTPEKKPDKFPEKSF